MEGKAPRRSTAHAALERELDAISEALAGAVADSAGIPELARIANRAIGASVAVCDSGGAVLAIAGASSADERDLIAGKADEVELRVGGELCGYLRYRPRHGKPSRYILRFLATTIALEVAARGQSQRPMGIAAAELVTSIVRGDGDDLIRELASKANVELGGGQFVCVNTRLRNSQEHDWRATVLVTVERGARTADNNALCACIGEQVYVLLPEGKAEVGSLAAERILKEAETDLSGFAVAIGVSATTGDRDHLPVCASEALLAANVAMATGRQMLNFNESGSYKLLLPALSSDRGELKSFFEESIGPLIEYDRQYQTGLVETLEAYLDNDGKIEATAKSLFAHRHTIRYRLDRVKELTQLDIGSSEGREKLSLGLKSMRVLGISAPKGTAKDG